MRPVAEGQAIATVSVLMYPPCDDEHKKRPQSVDKITFGFSDGSWDSEPDDDPAFKKFSVMPLSTGATMVYMAESEPDFEERLLGAVDEHNGTAYLRISVLRHFGAPCGDESAFAFFDLHGFQQAWKALPAYKDGSYVLSFEEHREERIREWWSHRREATILRKQKELRKQKGLRSQRWHDGH